MRGQGKRVTSGSSAVRPAASSRVSHSAISQCGRRIVVSLGSRFVEMSARSSKPITERSLGMEIPRRTACRKTPAARASL